MGTRVLRPRNNSLRNRTVADFKEITKSYPEKSLTEALPKKASRNNFGRITMRHAGGGHKRKYRLIDFKRLKLNIEGEVKSIEYDPNRTCRIALIQYPDGEKSYILAPVGLEVGNKVISSDKADIKPGNCLNLAAIPAGTIIHNVELRPGKGGQLVRGAGVGASLVAKLGQYCQVKLPSGEVRLILSTCKATVGQVGNTEHENIKIGKAGRKRWMGVRPTVRGMAMNPIDHPLGGGEGVGKGHHPVSPWGQPSKGYKTRKNKRTKSMIVKRRK